MMGKKIAGRGYNYKRLGCPVVVGGEADVGDVSRECCGVDRFLGEVERMLGFKMTLEPVEA